MKNQLRGVLISLVIVVAVAVLGVSRYAISRRIPHASVGAGMVPQEILKEDASSCCSCASQ